VTLAGALLLCDTCWSITPVR